jgi:hypothetical protein
MAGKDLRGLLTGQPTLYLGESGKNCRIDHVSSYLNADTTDNIWVDGDVQVHGFAVGRCQHTFQTFHVCCAQWSADSDCGNCALATFGGSITDAR